MNGLRCEIDVDINSMVVREKLSFAVMHFSWLRPNNSYGRQRLRLYLFKYHIENSNRMKNDETMCVKKRDSWWHNHCGNMNTFVNKHEQCTQLDIISRSQRGSGNWRWQCFEKAIVVTMRMTFNLPCIFFPFHLGIVEIKSTQKMKRSSRS